HRDNGALLTMVVLGHVALIVVGYASMDETSVTDETWTLLTTYEDMISAFVATGILVGIALLAIRTVRALLPYEVWYFLHLTSYLVLLLAYGHQFADGRDVSTSFGRSLWIGLYVFVLACLVWGRFLAPLALNLRHGLRIAEIVHEGPDTYSIYVSGRRLH